MTIKELREEKGLSQGKFAESIGIGRTAIVGYEKGKFKPSAEVAAKIKEVYGVDVDEAASAAPAPVEEKKTAKRGKKKAEAAPVAPAVEEKKTAKRGMKKTAPATEEKKPTKRGKKAAAAAAVEERKLAPKKRGTAKKDAGVTVVIQSPMGGSITPEEIIKKTGPVDAVYVRVDENKAYWVKGEETGAVDLW